MSIFNFLFKRKKPKIEFSENPLTLSNGGIGKLDLGKFKSVKQLEKAYRRACKDLGLE